MKLCTAYCTAAIMLMALTSVASAEESGYKAKRQQGNNQQQATAVPEPEVYGMMLAGLGIVGFAARRKLKAKVVKAIKD